MEKRTIESVCKTKGLLFQTILLDRNYCSLSFNRKVECKHLGEKSQDDLYYCELKREEEFMKN